MTQMTPAPMSEGELHAIAANPLTHKNVTAMATELLALREWTAAIVGLCAALGSDELEWGGDKTGWGFIHYFVQHLHTRATAAEAALRAPRKEQGAVDASDIVRQAYSCDTWPDWLHKIVDEVNATSDELDASMEQCVAHGVLLALAASPNGGREAREQVLDEAIIAARDAGNFGDYTREELTADFGQPRYDMMRSIIKAIDRLRAQPHVEEKPE